jgi:hypothetical protein
MIRRVTQELRTMPGRQSARRICLRCDVGILDERSGTRILGQLCDLSVSGARVRTQTPLPIGTELRLAFEFEPGTAPARLAGEVVWSSRDRHARLAAFDSGIRFCDEGSADVERLHAHIDRKLAAVQKFLSSFKPLADLGDVERAALASVSFEHELKAGESFQPVAEDDTLILVRAGTLTLFEAARAGHELAPRKLATGDVCGSLPIDPRGATKIKLRADADAALLCIPNDGFWQLWSAEPETALNVLACWTLSLRDRLLAVESIS